MRLVAAALIAGGLPHARAFSISGCQRANFLTSARPNMPCPTGSLGLGEVSLVGDKLLSACSTKSSQVCDDIGSTTVPTSCSSLMDEPRLGCDSLQGVAVRDDNLMVYGACFDMLTACNWSSATYTATACTQLQCICPSGCSTGGVTLSFGHLLVTCRACQSQSGIYKCVPGSSMVRIGNPCDAEFGRPGSVTGLSVPASGGLFVTCRFDRAVYCPFFDAVAMTIGVCTTFAGPTDCDRIWGVTELPGAKVALSCAQDGYFLCDAESVSPSAHPSPVRSSAPTTSPQTPTLSPSAVPTSSPTAQPTGRPFAPPTLPPSRRPSGRPSGLPSGAPSARPSKAPSTAPTRVPIGAPSREPSEAPAANPTHTPSGAPTAMPTHAPSHGPTQAPSGVPSVPPSRLPSVAPSPSPSLSPRAEPTSPPSTVPSAVPSTRPSFAPTWLPSAAPTPAPRPAPSVAPSAAPSVAPSGIPSRGPSPLPSRHPSSPPTAAPAVAPTASPSFSPAATADPSLSPEPNPSALPTMDPTSQSPTRSPTYTRPTASPAGTPTGSPNHASPTESPTTAPTAAAPTASPSQHLPLPTMAPLPLTLSPTRHTPTLLTQPTLQPSTRPTAQPGGSPGTAHPTRQPSLQPARSPWARPPTDSPVAAGPTAPPSIWGPPPEPPGTRVPSLAPSAQPRSASAAPTHPAPRDSRTMPADADNALFGSVAVGSVLDSPSPGMTSLALIAGVQCPEYEAPAELNVALHPLRFRVDGDLFLGAIVGNSVVCVAAALGGALLMALCHAASGRLTQRPALELHSEIRLPGALLMPAIILFQGTSYSLMRTLLRPPGAGVWPFVGALGVLGVAFPPLAVDRLVAAPSAAEAAYVHDPTTSPFLAFLIGPGEWVSNSSKLWNDRCGSALKSYKPLTVVAAHRMQFAESFAVSVLSAGMISMEMECDAFNFVLAAVVLVHGMWCLRVRPYARPRDEVHEASLTLLLTAVGIVKGIGYCSGPKGDPLFAVADKLLIVATVATAVKLIADLATDIYVACSHRQVRLQTAHVETQERVPCVSPELIADDVCGATETEGPEGGSPERSARACSTDHTLEAAILTFSTDPEAGDVPAPAVLQPSGPAPTARRARRRVDTVLSGHSRSRPSPTPHAGQSPRKPHYRRFSLDPEILASHELSPLAPGGRGAKLGAKSPRGAGATPRRASADDKQGTRRRSRASLGSIGGFTILPPPLDPVSATYSSVTVSPPARRQRGVHASAATTVLEAPPDDDGMSRRPGAH
eukprot:TRINITY_DN15942_c0_g1_i1.p1 TRINITY_DN15942_c0_g1~~TRINITY_DN15942_c0_g1_i1.p1  ORF type:complete len:1265 (+),score=24.10 TRINITY_DN15942_c0_g1_i1:78-3872(+)